MILEPTNKLRWVERKKHDGEQYDIQPTEMILQQWYKLLSVRIIDKHRGEWRDINIEKEEL